MNAAAIRFYGNSCVQVDCGGTSILCDPWLTDGAFEGSWYHDPPLLTQPADISGYTVLYISHIHPDHFDPGTLLRLPYQVPVLLCGDGTPALRRQVEALGFPIISLAAGEETKIDGTTFTMFGPFAANPLWPSGVPNVIDSALVIEGDGFTVLNANDNTPDSAACKMMVERFNRLDVALLPYSGASEFPSCFPGIDRATAAEEKIVRYLDRLDENVRTLCPVRVVPFAGQYRLGGRLRSKNEFLGVPDIQRAVERITASGSLPILLNEGDELELRTGRVRRAHLSAPRPSEPDFYWYEDAFSFTAAQQVDLLPLVKAARSTLRAYQDRFGWEEPHRLQLKVLDGACYVLDFATDEVRVEDSSPEPPYTSITVGYGLLLALLTRHAHWNNAAIGGHLSFERQPEAYVPEVFTLLSFLHV